jgi:IS5 family transposase
MAKVVGEVTANERPIRGIHMGKSHARRPIEKGFVAIGWFKMGDLSKLPGCEIERGYVDKGYRGHDTENPRRVFISGQKRGVFGAIKRELRRRSAIEPIIGHMKAEGHLGRCYLKGRAGDAANAVLSAVGHNFRRILAWLRALLRFFMIAIARLSTIRSALNPAY